MLNHLCYLLLGTTLLLACTGTARAQAASLPPDEVTMKLQRGNFTLRRYQARRPANAPPKALIIFGSGSGGWSSFEEKICTYLQSEGYKVLGLDFSLYAQTDYDADTLERDYHTIVDTGRARFTKHPPPVILGGWSTGAEQAASVAADPSPPAGLTGLLLISPGSEGGYGPYALSYFSIDPPTTRYFLMAELAPKLKDLRIAQWHAEYDPLDSRAWLKTLPVPHREFDFPGAIHDFRDACPEFLTQLGQSVDWIRTGATPRATAPSQRKAAAPPGHKHKG